MPARSMLHVVNVGLVQVNMGLTWSAPGRGRQASSVTFGLLPYSVGLLQAYAERHAAERHRFLVPIHQRVSLAEGVESLAEAELVGFSAYVWNIEVSLAIAERVKRERPGTIIVFGGPQVPDRAEAFLRAHPFIDVVCHGEGEATFTQILDAAPGGDFSAVPGTSSLREGRFVHRPRAARIANLETIPSPFLSGAFDALIDAHPGEQWVAMWETNRGCPFSCSFCDWGSATASKVYRFGMERLESEIAWMAATRVGFVFCCDANFGMLRRDYEIAEAVVASKQRTGFPFSFSVQNTKNAVERGYRVQKLLNQSLNAYGATISLQSVNPDTLRHINRANISSEAFSELQRRFAREGVYTYTDIIIGLPGESYDAFADGVAKVIADGQHNHIQFHNCSVLPNAEMGNPKYQQRYGMRTVAQAIRNVHASLDEAHEVEEHLDVVVATEAMPAGDWRRAKVFAWLTDFAYFDRVLQAPLAVLSARHGLSARALIESLIRPDPERHPVTYGVHQLLTQHAAAIQRGGPEYFAAPEWGNLLWPADQYALLGLVASGTLAAFYTECTDLLGRTLADAGVTGEELLLGDAISLAQAMLRLPGQEDEGRLVLAHNLHEHYWGLLRGEEIPLRQEIARYIVDRTSTRWATIDEWCEHLTWCHNKDKRGYIHPARRVAGPGRPLAALAA